MLARVLFSLGGFAAGLLVAFAIAAGFERPSEREGALAKQVEDGLVAIESYSRQVERLQQGLATGNAALEQLIDEKADLEAELEQAQNSADRDLAAVAEAATQAASRNAEAEAEQERTEMRLAVLLRNLKIRLAAEEERSRESQAFGKEALDRLEQVSAKLDAANERLRDANLEPVE